MLVSELAGRGNVTYKIKELGLNIEVPRDKTAALVEEIKDKENNGYQYEGAEASFELLVRRTLDDYATPFELVDYMVIVEQRRRPSEGYGQEDLLSEATVKVKVGAEVRHTAAAGNGPVNALRRE